MFVLMFDRQRFWVSSIKFDYRTKSKSNERLEFDWVRLLNVWLVTLDIIKGHAIGQVIFPNQYCGTFSWNQTVRLSNYSLISAA